MCHWGCETATDVVRLDAGASSADAHLSVLDASLHTPDAAVEPTVGDYIVADTPDERLRGEVIAIYDRSQWWWTPQDERLYALFDAEAYRSDYLLDRSVHIASSRELQSLVRVGIPLGALPFDQFMREQSFVWARVPLDGIAYILNAHEGYHLQEDGYGDFAWDLSRTDPKGARFTGGGTENADYLIWHATVFSPAAGTIVELVRDAPDNMPGAYPEGATNNLIGIALGGAYYLYLLHFAEGSIPKGLDVGSQVEVGTILGLVGNSGVSLEPHLHVTALYYDTSTQSPRTYSVPSEFKDVYSGTSGDTIRLDFHAPLTGHHIANEPF